MPTLHEISAYYAGLSDKALIAAYRLGRGSYEPAAWDLINYQIKQRGLIVGDESPQTPASAPAFADTLMSTAEDLLNEGLDVGEIAERLTADGLPADRASSIADAAEQERANELTAANKEIRRGAWTLGVGLVVTLATFSSASKEGGTYVVAYGAIIFGFIRLVRGNSRRDRALGLDPVTGRPRDEDTPDQESSRDS
jgi:hypothetical protein